MYTLSLLLLGPAPTINRNNGPSIDKERDRCRGSPDIVYGRLVRVARNKHKNVFISREFGTPLRVRKPVLTAAAAAAFATIIRVGRARPPAVRRTASESVCCSARVFRHSTQMAVRIGKYKMKKMRADPVKVEYGRLRFGRITAVWKS